MDRPDPRNVIHHSETTANAGGCVHLRHRDFPELHAEGNSPHECALLLLQQLERALDSSEAGWPREHLCDALADVEAYARSVEPQPVTASR